MEQKLKIYSPYSYLDGVKRFGGIYDEVLLGWHAQDRKKPIADYQDLVIGYEGLNEYEKERARVWIDEGFTEEEIAVIRPIIESSSYDFSLCEKALPVIIQEDERFPFWAYEDLSIGRGEGFMSLKGHGLPFDVVGYYNINDGIERNAKNVDKIHQELEAA